MNAVGLQQAPKVEEGHPCAKKGRTPDAPPWYVLVSKFPLVAGPEIDGHLTVFQEENEE